MNIVLNFQSNVSSAPAGFKTALLAAADFFNKSFSNNITVSIDVNYGTIASGADGGTNNAYVHSYAAYRTAMLGQATKSADDTTALASLPTTDPTAASSSWLGGNALDKALGLTAYSTVAGTSDGGIDFQADGAGGIHYNTSTTNRAVSGLWDLVGVAEHEISHVLGRYCGLNGSGFYAPLDLFHYQGNGTSTAHSYTAGTAAHFSINGGSTNLANFSTSSDPGDWDSSAGSDANTAFSSVGTANLFTETDMRELDILGYTRASTGIIVDTGPVVTILNPSGQMGSEWHVVNSGDFNGDGTADILWARNATGDAALWTMGKGALTGFGATQGHMGSEWSTVNAAADFNHDGHADILWARNTTGDVAIWEMNGTNLVNYGLVAGHMGAEWKVSGIGDFNGDGYSDILWVSNTGQAAVWGMNGLNLASFGLSNGKMGAEWNVQAVADFDGNGRADILWVRNTGDIQMWSMNGANYTSITSVGHLGTEWHVAGTADVNKDGKQDIVWVDTANHVQIWEMNGAQIANTVVPGGTIATDWQLKSVADHTGSGHPDLLWVSATGLTQIWSVNLF